ncbi:Uncharacterised protein [Mycobacteroides abscessus subsp. abscessus]|nr:Uncharacterised protein [Mycobacteroides abscessus subsp. abscessus]
MTSMAPKFTPRKTLTMMIVKIPGLEKTWPFASVDRSIGGGSVDFWM